jgi:hypothetical protein
MKAKQKLHDDDLRAQNEIQERENKIKQEKHEEALNLLKAKKAKKALEHASKVDA